MGRKEIIASSAITVRRLSKVIFLIGGVGCMVGMVLLILGDILLRNLFNRPIMSSYELTQFMMVGLVFTSLSYAQSEKGLVRVELLLSQLPARAQSFLEMVMSLVGLVLVLLMAWRNLIRAIELYGERLTSPILHCPVYPFYLVVALGLGLLALVLLADTVESASNFRAGG